MVDWDLALVLARRWSGSGPTTTVAEASGVVDELRDLALAAQEHVVAFTGLRPADDSAIVVVGRPEWARSNLAGLRVLLAPVIDSLAARRPPTRAVSAAGRRVTALQLGTALAYLSSRVLGQYEVFRPAPAAGGPAPGRLALVAPNIVSTERALKVVPRDFRMWVCLHEQTHRVQFGAVGWMREYFTDEVRELLTAVDIDASALLDRLQTAVGGLARAARDRSVPSLVDLVVPGPARDHLNRLQALMTLLEGHAEYVMDAVGPSAVPSVSAIRRAFEARRATRSSPLDLIVHRVLGLDAKLEQYRSGRRFVDAVVTRVGMDGFNRVWTDPTALPDLAEIADPDRWLQRMAPQLPLAVSG